jgi:peptide/nickel transport system substrate-binding protein
MYQESLKKAGINIEVKRVSGDGYWDNVWMKAPFCSVFWGNRPTADLQISTQFLGGGAWNDTHFKSAAMDKLVIAARVELNEAKRREMYAESQRIISEDAGMVCFAVGDQMDGGSKKLMGLESHARYDMNDNRLAEKGWFA